MVFSNDFLNKYQKELCEKDIIKALNTAIKTIGYVYGFHGYLEDKFEKYDKKRFKISRNEGNEIGFYEIGF